MKTVKYEHRSADFVEKQDFPIKAHHAKFVLFPTFLVHHYDSNDAFVALNSL